MTRVRLQILLEQGTEGRASAIVRYARKVPHKEVGQDLFMLQSLGRETVAREGIVPLCGRPGWASLLRPRVCRYDQDLTLPQHNVIDPPTKQIVPTTRADHVVQASARLSRVSSATRRKLDPDAQSCSTY